MYIYNLYVFGTIINIDFEGHEDLKIEIRKLLYQLDDLCSKYKIDSDINKINTTYNAIVDPLVIDIINKSIYYSNITDGYMDITSKYVKNKNELSLINYKNIKINNNNVRINEGMSIDLGSIVKGYATDMIVDLLVKNNIDNAIIDLGGNVYVLGNHKVGIADPFYKHSIVGYMELNNKSVVTSGNYERGKHIINPYTVKFGSSKIKSVSIIADKSLDAEGLSTAYFIKGVDNYSNINGIDTIYIDKHRHIYLTKNIENKFIIVNKKYKIKEVL